MNKYKKEDFKVINREDKDKSKWTLSRQIEEEFNIDIIKESKKNCKVAIQKTRNSQKTYKQLAEKYLAKVKTDGDMYKLLESLPEESAKWVALWAYYTSMDKKSDEMVEEAEQEMEQYDQYIKFLEDEVLCQDNEK